MEIQEGSKCVVKSTEQREGWVGRGWGWGGVGCGGGSRK